MKLSAYFTLDEFERSQTAVRLGIDNTAPKAVIENLRQLCIQVLDLIREYFGPIYVLSGYRCRELNRYIGGSAKSQHYHGQAADIVIAGYDCLAVCQWIDDSELPFDQLIYEGTWAHVSWSLNPRGQVLTAYFSKSGTTYTSGLS